MYEDYWCEHENPPYYLSAYALAVKAGFTGTEEEWLASLVGPKGAEGPQGPQGPKGDSSWFVHVGTSSLAASGYEASKTYAQIRQELSVLYGKFGIPENSKMAFCVLWAPRITQGEYMFLPLNRHDSSNSRFSFTQVEGNYEIVVYISSEGVYVTKTFLALQEQLQESFVVHVRMSEETGEYEAVQSYKRLFDAADELFAGGNARPVYCAFWTDSVKEYILLPLTSYDSRAKQFTFTRIDVDYGLYVTITEQGVNVVKTDLGLTDQMPTKLPNPNALSINGKSYDGTETIEVDTRPVVVTVNAVSSGFVADKTLTELERAHEDGRTLYCNYGGVWLPLVSEYGSKTSNTWGYTFQGFNFGNEYKVLIGTDGIRVITTNLIPDALPNPWALTINGRSYDGSQPVEVVTEPLVVIVDDTNNSYTTQNSLEEVAAALEAGRDVWCECAGGRFPFVDRWGSTAASHGYNFSGIKSGVIHQVSFGTNGISVSVAAPKIKQSYHLIQKIELAEESNSILFSNLGLRALRAFFVVPQAAATASVGAELYMGSNLAGTAWLPNLISDASGRVSMVEGWQDGGLVGFAGVAPANTTQQAQTYSRCPRYAAVAGSFTKLRMYGSGGKMFPVGTVVELWGY